MIGHLLALIIYLGKQLVQWPMYLQPLDLVHIRQAQHHFCHSRSQRPTQNTAHCLPSGFAHAPLQAAGVRADASAATALDGRMSGSASVPWPPHMPAAAAYSGDDCLGLCSGTGAIATEALALPAALASDAGGAAGRPPGLAASPPRTPCSPCTQPHSLLCQVYNGFAHNIW